LAVAFRGTMRNHEKKAMIVKQMNIVRRKRVSMTASAIDAKSQAKSAANRPAPVSSLGVVARKEPNSRADAVRVEHGPLAVGEGGYDPAEKSTAEWWRRQAAHGDR
jgi:hypothetical protein